jgi:hypothetical protein
VLVRRASMFAISSRMRCMVASMVDVVVERGLRPGIGGRPSRNVDLSDTKLLAAGVGKKQRGANGRGRTERYGR